MKGYGSALLKDGKPLSEEYEMAHILARTYAAMGKDFLASVRKTRNWGLGLFISGAVAFLALVWFSPAAAVILGLLGAGVGGGILYWNSTRRPKFQVTKLGKGYWVSEFYDFEGGKVLVDKSQMTPSLTFQVPVPAMDADTMVKLGAEAQQLWRNTPILVKKNAGPSGSGDSDPLVGMADRLDRFSTALDQAHGQVVSMNVLPGSAALTQAIVKDAGSAEAVRPRNALVSPNAADVKNQLQDLGRLTATARQSTGQSSSLEELTERVLGELESASQELDTVQRTSLIQILGKQLLRLERAYRAPMMLYYCPHCLDRTAKELKFDLAETMEGAEVLGGVGGSGPAQGEGRATVSSTEHLAETIERFATTTRAAVMRLERSGRDGSAERQWHCPLCDKRFPLEDPQVMRYRAYRAKQELVLPLWDQLWMELSSERAGLLERKDKEHRENVDHENQETVHAADQFAAERREVKNRVEDLNTSTARALSVFSNLMDSFVSSGLVSRAEIAGDEASLKSRRQEFSAKLDEIDGTIAGIEEGLAKECEDTLKRRGPLLDYAEEVKWRSQLMPPDQKEPEAFVVQTPI